MFSFTSLLKLIFHCLDHIGHAFLSLRSFSFLTVTQTVLSLLIEVQLKQFKSRITSDVFIHSLKFIECLPHVRHCATGRGPRGESDTVSALWLVHSLGGDVQ